ELTVKREFGETGARAATASPLGVKTKTIHTLRIRGLAPIKWASRHSADSRRLESLRTPKAHQKSIGPTEHGSVEDADRIVIAWISEKLAFAVEHEPGSQEISPHDADIDPVSRDGGSARIGTPLGQVIHDHDDATRLQRVVQLRQQFLLVY